jgi:LacI family repressor for deo operon, udp, cdd, tsx, nupC, and nupG
MAKRRTEETVPKKPQHRAVTILDVARRAGVSTATVSRTLAVPERVAEATRAAVFAAIRETGFTPNATARNLRARSTKMVLALLHGLGNSFYTAILNAIEEVLFEAGYGVVMGDTRANPGHEAHYDKLVRSGLVDGVLLLSGRLPGKDFAELDSTVPITLICNDIPDRDLPVFETANRDAARRMVDYLVGVGHRRIAHVTGPGHNVEARERILGYRDGLAAAGVAVDESLIWDGTFRLAGGEAAGRRYLAMSERPTAVFCGNDETAMGFIKTVRDAGLSIPRDVSVSGFDDIEYSALFEPALTTMCQPRAELGRLAAESLVRRMTGTAGTVPRRTRLPCTLAVRDSVTPPRSARETVPGRRGVSARS